MRDGRRRRLIFLTLLAAATLVSTSMLAPAFGAPKAVSAASLAKKLSRTLTIAKRADRNAKRAIAGLQNVSGGGTGGTGATGPAGPRGPAGPKGDKGDPGSASSVGATGPQGPKGDTGDKGDQGLQGLKGDQGDQGDQGLKGDKGDKGDQGLQGNQGIQGIQGVQGPAGFDSTFITTEVFTTAGGSFTTAIIDCPSGSTAVGGGYSVSDSLGNLFNVMQDRPVGDGSGWLIRMRSGAANPFDWTGWVICA